MERYLGGDVHAASVSFTVRSEAGKILRRDVIETNGQALVNYVRQQAGQVHLCIEEGELSQWLYEVLSPHLSELIVYRPRWSPGSKKRSLGCGWTVREAARSKVWEPGVQGSWSVSSASPGRSDLPDAHEGQATSRYSASAPDDANRSA